MREFEYQPAERTILIPKPSRRDASEVYAIRVPALLGPIHAVERRGAFIVVRAQAGKASYHYQRKGGNLGAPDRAGYMVWNSLRKTVRGLCLAPRFAKRVDMHVLYFRNGNIKGGSGSSPDGVVGRVTVDKQVVAEGNALGFALAPALERYLHLEPAVRLDDDEPIIRAFALLDRDTQALELSPREEDAADPLWQALYALRVAASAEQAIVR